MKKSLILALLLGVAGLFADGLPAYVADQHPQGGGGEKMAPLNGKTGPKIQVFNGGRPWVGNMLPGSLVSAGARVLNVNAPYLDGYAGATIKTHIGDKVEPKAFDGITPALKKANTYKLLIFNHILPECQEMMFTSERIAQLKSYVENGGNILFTIDVPAKLGELLPVTFGKYQILDTVYSANRPAGSIYKSIPEVLPVYRFYREATLKSGAQALSVIRDASGKEVAPYVARIKIGKGTVTFFNTELTNPTQILDFSNWAYSRAFFVALASDCFGGKLKPGKCISKLEAIPERKQVGETTASVIPPKNAICDSNDLVQVSGKTATFGNGMKLEVAADGTVSITWKGKNKPFVKNYQIPAIRYSKKQKVFDSKTAEAVDVKEDLTAADIKWQFKSLTANGNLAVLTYIAKDSELHWVFKIGRLDLDGRSFDGFADRIELVKSPLLVSGIGFESELDLDEPLYAHRFDCYQPPRGYTAFDMTGKVKSDTKSFAGQPFAMIVCKNGVYLGNRSMPTSASACFIREKGGKTIKSKHSEGLGRIYAPLATQFYWQWYADGTERGHNDYLAMYQFMRHLLRTEAGLKELPAYPVASYGYQMTDKEKDQVIEFAGKAGYRFIFPANPESPIEAIDSPANMEIYGKIAKVGARARIWTAGSYVQGDGGWIINHHPEWFAKDEKGKIFKYFGTYPVIDVNDPEFYDWYTKVLKHAIDGGVGWVYRDMDAAASGTVNYGKKESPNGLKAQIKFYKFFHDNDCRVGIEGMNPLVIDIYWYRPAVYTSFAGKEFVLVGSMPSDELRGGITLDTFRTGMYGCFPSFQIADIVFNIERIPGELDRIRRTLAFVPRFNEALDLVGMPYVRETEFGTVWTGEKGGALFFWNPAKKVTVDLPEGWKIKGVEGNVLTDVKEDTIVLIEKK